MSEDIRIVDFGALDAVAEVTITIDPRDVSVLFLARSVDPTEYVAVTAIIGPDGEPLYVYDDFETGEITSEMFVEPVEQEGEVALFLPAAPQFDIEPGDYIVTGGNRRRADQSGCRHHSLRGCGWPAGN